MTDQHIKEQLSKHLFCLLASWEGYKISEPNLDNGVDLMLIKVKRVQMNGHPVFLDTGDIVAVQLKCTTENRIVRGKKQIKFDLEVKNYNDLVYRFQDRKRTKNQRIPLFLVILVLPTKTTNWILSNTNDGINTVINGGLYWFYPSDETKVSKNRRTQRIEISNENLITINNFDEVIKKILKQL